MQLRTEDIRFTKKRKNYIWCLTNYLILLSKPDYTTPVPKYKILLKIFFIPFYNINPLLVPKGRAPGNPEFFFPFIIPLSNFLRHWWFLDHHMINYSAFFTTICDKYSEKVSLLKDKKSLFIGNHGLVGLKFLSPFCLLVFLQFDHW
jgi:hypothetical protein